MKEGKPQFQNIDQESIVPKKPDIGEGGNSTEIINSEQSESKTEDTAAEQIEQRKEENDPTRVFLREHGFDGDPKITYSLDTIVAVNDKGEKFAGKETFTNYEEMQEFVRNNPEAVGKKEMMKMSGIVPYRIDYDPSVYEWSSKLSKEDEQKLADAWEGFGEKMMDVKNFEKVGDEEPATEPIKNEIAQTENQVLSRLNNPEMSKIIGEQNEIDEVIRTMVADARFADNDGIEGQELQRLNECMEKGDMLKADELLAGYVARSTSKKLNETLNRLDISIPWEDKAEMLKSSIELEKIRGRQEGMRTHDLLTGKQNLDAMLAKFETKKPTEQNEEKEKKEDALTPEMAMQKLFSEMDEVESKKGLGSEKGAFLEKMTELLRTTSKTGDAQSYKTFRDDSHFQKLKIGSKFLIQNSFDRDLHGKVFDYLDSVGVKTTDKEKEEIIKYFETKDTEKRKETFDSYAKNGLLTLRSAIEKGALKETSSTPGDFSSSEDFSKMSDEKESNIRGYEVAPEDANDSLFYGRNSFFNVAMERGGEDIDRAGKIPKIEAENRMRNTMIFVVKPDKVEISRRTENDNKEDVVGRDIKPEEIDYLIVDKSNFALAKEAYGHLPIKIIEADSAEADIEGLYDGPYAVPNYKEKIEQITKAEGPIWCHIARLPVETYPKEPAVKKNPFEKDFASHEREWARSLNSPETGYNSKRGVAAMAEVFQKLYSDPEQLEKRMESLIKEYQATMEKSKKDNPEKEEFSHQSFASKTVIENLKEEEKKAIHKYAENNKKLGGSRNGGVSITINAELPMTDFLAHIEKIKR